MPGRFERHRRSKWEWGTPGSRSAETRTAASPDPEPARKAPAKKDTRHWCRGKQGVEHVPHLVLDERAPGYHKMGCQWGTSWRVRQRDYTVRWQCQHREICTRCSKILREPWEIGSAECPVYPGDEAQRAAAGIEADEATARHTSWWSGRRKAITGPQGYRRNRG